MATLQKSEKQSKRGQSNLSTTRLWERPPYTNKDEFAKFVKVQHKEPTEPQDKPNNTYYGVMSRVYQDAFNAH